MNDGDGGGFDGGGGSGFEGGSLGGVDIPNYTLEAYWISQHGGAPPIGVDEQPISFGRNAPCPCGSGLKYKKCCLKDPKALRSRIHGGEIAYGARALAIILGAAVVISFVIVIALAFFG